MIIKNIKWNETDMEEAQFEGISLPDTVTIDSKKSEDIDWEYSDDEKECISEYLDGKYDYTPVSFDIEWQKDDAKVYEVTVTDTATYRIRANSEGEARNQAWDWFNEREPDFNIKVVEGKADDEL